MRCAECESIDDIIFETTTFWLYLPTKDCVQRMEALMAGFSVPCRSFAHNGMSFTVKKGQVSHIATAIFGELNGKELAETRIISTPTEQEPAVQDMGRMMSGDVFIARINSQWLVNAIRDERYTTHYQPIVHANKANNLGVFAMEGLFRIRDDQDTIIPPGYVFDLAEKTDMLFALDIAARTSAVMTASRGGYQGNLFINFNPSSIYDPAYCLRTTAATINAVGIDPSQITFELTETHRARDMNHLKGILRFYRQAGFKVALDDIGAGWSGLNMMHELRPDFIKIDMDLVRNIDKDSFKQTIVRHLIAMAKQNGIEVIAEGIETETEATIVRACGADYLQGYLFAKPAPVEDHMAKRAA